MNLTDDSDHPVDSIRCMIHSIPFRTPNCDSFPIHSTPFRIFRFISKYSFHIKDSTRVRSSLPNHFRFFAILFNDRVIHHDRPRPTQCGSAGSVMKSVRKSPLPVLLLPASTSQKKKTVVSILQSASRTVNGELSSSCSSIIITHLPEADKPAHFKDADLRSTASSSQLARAIPRESESAIGTRYRVNTNCCALTNGERRCYECLTND